VGHHLDMMHFKSNLVLKLVLRLAKLRSQSAVAQVLSTKAPSQGDDALLYVSLCDEELPNYPLSGASLLWLSPASYPNEVVPNPRNAVPIAISPAAIALSYDVDRRLSRVVDAFVRAIRWRREAPPPPAFDRMFGIVPRALGSASGLLN